MPVRLGVNIDHVATIRQARGGHEPEPTAAALLAQGAGAHGITVHLRADRRHIQERDIKVLKDVLAVPLNVECAATSEAMEAVVPIKPAWVTLVPETREELTTQGGLDVLFLHAHLRQIIRELHASEIRVSLFIDPQQEQVKMAAKLEAEAVEFNTGVYADLTPGADPLPELNRLREASRLASKLGLKVLAGHGLSLFNVGPVAAIPEVEELNIGHSIIGRALLVGLDLAVREMITTINEGGQ
ncbi:pyridoxine 5'-phosphate synthase [Mesoterricola silvestris]|uniref:Pyridoxine 5'-phosphate synthase n=1 Tax=Mesoterricola silvestris TaxID=2927979 RepID=A0AA48GQR9_9BACT|nr:pyridoxine 5'-phosphate synthase [Mesoterricola silvestris]BDU72495.1 pyridoxine 5'-phosphate synthase [Mesoterricola silvestris]